MKLGAKNNDSRSLNRRQTHDKTRTGKKEERSAKSESKARGFVPVAKFLPREIRQPAKVIT